MAERRLYVFDTSSFIVLGHYYPDTFASFWAMVNDFVAAGQLISVEQVYQELDQQAAEQHLVDWFTANRGIFKPPTEDELHAVAEIFQVAHFQQLIGQRQVQTGAVVADPFVIARARVADACVVTQETLRPNAARIPNVCAHFGVECTNLAGLFLREGWRF